MLKKAIKFAAVLLLFSAIVLGVYLFRPLAKPPIPAEFHCYDLDKGRLVPLEAPPQAFGIGLSYAAHIRETASEFDPDQPPPVFRKDVGSFVYAPSTVKFPVADALFAQAETVEPGLGHAMRDRFPEMDPLLDYEGELGFVLMDDIEASDLQRVDFVPSIGFFLTNDLSARSLALMGEGRKNRYEYWGASKSFPGFMPVSKRAWVPDEPRANGIPRLVIETKVNGEVRQSQTTDQMIYTPLEMLRFIHARYPDAPLVKGTMVFTGTPGGVAIRTPRWLVRMANLMGFDREKKLSTKLSGDRSLFLKPGDEVTVKIDGLGSIETVVVSGD